MTDKPDPIGPKIRALAANAQKAIDAELAEARRAGEEAGRIARGLPPIPSGYHDPSEPRSEEPAAEELAVNPEDDCVATDKDGDTWIREDESEPWWKLDRPLARVIDPETSHEAAASLQDKVVRESQMAIRALLHYHGPQTDEEIRVAYESAMGRPGVPRQSPSGLRTRRHELVEMGYVRFTGNFKLLPSGRRGRIWEEIPTTEEATK